MARFKKKLFSIVISAAFAVNIIAFTPEVSADTVTERVQGKDRYETSASISKKGWKKSEYAIIATGEDYADSLCSVPLAKVYDAPILLTGREELNDEVKDELKRLEVKKVVIAGGEGAVSKKVEEAVKKVNSIDVDRIAGSDRYETSTAIAYRLFKAASAKNIKVDRSCVLASGRGFADALSIAPIAAIKTMPILLTEKDEIPESIKSYILNEKVSKTYIVGGEGCISSSVEIAAKDITKNAPLRLYGKDRYETNVNVIKYFEKELSFNNIFVAVGEGNSGNEFADALSGAALAAKNEAPMFLTYKNTGKAAEEYLREKFKDINSAKLIVLGGEAAVPSTIADNIKNIIDEAVAVKKLEEKKKEEEKKKSSKKNHSSNNNNSNNNSNNNENGRFGTNPVVEVIGSKVTIICTNNEAKEVSIAIQNSAGNIYYIDKADFKDEKAQVSTILPAGKYTVKVNMQSPGAKKSVTEFEVK